MYFRDAKYKHIFISFISILVFLLFPILLYATTFTVNNTADTVDVNPGNGVCADGSGNCTLRAAIQETNALSGADTINVPAGTYILSIEGIDEDASATGDLDITDYLTINGAGEINTLIDANYIDRVLHITKSVIVEIEDLTITGGKNIGVENNGGILTLTNINVTGILDRFVTGIYNDGTLTMTNCTVSGNSSGAMSDCRTTGIHNEGVLTLTNSSVSDNHSSARDNNHTTGIHNEGVLTLTNSSVSGNDASSRGGGVTGIYNGGSSYLTNSTVGENGFGVGINNGGTLTMTNCTVSKNGGVGYYGGASAVGISNSGTVTLTNSIVADHLGEDCNGLITSNDYNLDSDGTCNLTQPHDLPNTDPFLGEFNDDGSPGRGHFPLSAYSPAIDKGNDDACLPTDQLGNPRVDGDNDGIVTCDIGAIESQPREINDYVTFVPNPSTFAFSPDTTDCHAGAVGKFTFDAILTNISVKELSNLHVEVDELTNNNLLLTDTGLIGEGESFEVPKFDDYADDILSNEEFVDVPFTVCLQDKKPFRFFVNVLGTVKIVMTNNLLTNPGAETGSLEGWLTDDPETVIASKEQGTDCGLVLPHSGEWFFSMTWRPADPNSILYQEIDVSGYALEIDNGIVKFLANTYFQTEHPGYDPGARLDVLFFDQFGNPISGTSGYSTGIIQSPFCTWDRARLQDLQVSVGTRKIRVELFGQESRYAATHYINALFDNVNFQLVY